MFWNMEKMDIQAERRNTEEQRQRADTAITILIKSYQKAGISNDAILQILTNELGMDKNEAVSKLKQWAKSAVLT